MSEQSAALVYGICGFAYDADLEIKLGKLASGASGLAVYYHGERGAPTLCLIIKGATRRTTSIDLPMSIDANALTPNSTWDELLRSAVAELGLPNIPNPGWFLAIRA